MKFLPLLFKITDYKCTECRIAKKNSKGTYRKKKGKKCGYIILYKTNNLKDIGKKCMLEKQLDDEVELHHLTVEATVCAHNLRLSFMSISFFKEGTFQFIKGFSFFLFS